MRELVYLIKTLLELAEAVRTPWEIVGEAISGLVNRKPVSDRAEDLIMESAQAAIRMLHMGKESVSFDSMLMGLSVYHLAATIKSRTDCEAEAFWPVMYQAGLLIEKADAPDWIRSCKIMNLVDFAHDQSKSIEDAGLVLTIERPAGLMLWNVKVRQSDGSDVLLGKIRTSLYSPADIKSLSIHNVEGDEWCAQIEFHRADGGRYQWEFEFTISKEIRPLFGAYTVFDKDGAIVCAMSEVRLPATI